MVEIGTPFGMFGVVTMTVMMMWVMMVCREW